MAARNRMGLSILYDPAKAAKKTTTDVDLVLVHGLNGGYLQTWTCTTGESAVVWPKDLLPTAQPKTRVLSFGYSGDIYENPSTSGIRDIARSLLSSLKLRRNSDRNKPIVFIAHCLGGLIVKQALCFANNEDEYYPIAKATHSVLFFGTPHFGADKKKWLSIANAFSPLAKKQTDKATGKSKPSVLVEMITRKAHDLAEISEDFCQKSSHYKIKTFYEELPFEGTGKVIVDRMDCHMFLDNEVPKGVHADHLGIVQFEDEDDETFLHVCQYISDAVIVEEEVKLPSTPPPAYSPALPQPYPGEALEEWAARERMFREMVRAMGALNSGRSVHISPSSPARRPAMITPPAGQHIPTTLRLLDSPAQKSRMPWDMDEIEEEKVTAPTSGRVPGNIWKLEEEEEKQPTHAPISRPPRPQLFGNQKHDEKITPSTFTPTPTPQTTSWMAKKHDGWTTPWATDACVEDEDVDEWCDGEETTPQIVRNESDRPKVTEIHLDEKKTSVTITAVSPDKSIHHPPQSRTSTDEKTATATLRDIGGSELEVENGVSAGEHRRISGFFSKVWNYSMGRA